MKEQSIDAEALIGKMKEVIGSLIQENLILKIQLEQFKSDED
jgi:regulator of replication initiation timing